MRSTERTGAGAPTSTCLTAPSNQTGPYCVMQSAGLMTLAICGAFGRAN